MESMKEFVARQKRLIEDARNQQNPLTPEQREELQDKFDSSSDKDPPKK